MEGCPPVFPGTYNGTVRLGGVPAVDGTVLKALIGEKEWASTSIVDGRYALDIPEVMPAYPPCFEGGTITFLLNDAVCDQTPEWTSGLHDLDLTCQMSNGGNGSSEDSTEEGGEKEMASGEREFETGKDEAWFANIKRTYDEYQQVSLESTKNNQAYVAKVVSDAQVDTEAKRNIANQALQNAVETANMIGKQAVAHRDIAINKEWNLEPSEAAAQAHVLPVAQVEAIRAVVVAILTELGLVGKKD